MKITSLVLAACLPVAALAQSTEFSITAGYQWLDVSGNEQSYRTQTGQQEGFALRSFALTTTSDGVFDRLRVEAGGFGATPDARLRLEADRAGAYRMTLVMRRSEVYSALPAFGDPLAELGLIPGQRTFDRTRTSFDLDLELLPGRSISPLIGYSRHTYEGPGRTALFVGGDQFTMVDDIDETVDELRLGVEARMGGFTARILQGWRSIDSRQSFALGPGAGAGLGSTPIFGHQLELSDFSRSERIDGDSPVTTALLSGTLGSRVRLVASFARTDHDSEISERETATGSLISFAIGRLYSGLVEDGDTRAEGPAWRGEARVEAELLPWLDLVASHLRSNRDITGRALISSLYTGTTTFFGADPRDVTEVLSARTAYEREEATSEARLVARPLKALRLWASWATVDQTTTVNQDAAEIVVPGSQSGSFERSIDRLQAGAAVTVGPALLTLDWADDDADRAVIRTDALDRERWRARVVVRELGPVRLAASYEDVELSNPTAGIDFSGESKSWSAEAEVAPIEALAFTLAYGKSEANTSIVVRRPQDFVLEPSLWAEDGETREASLRFALGRVRLQGGLMQFENEGSYPLQLDRVWADLHVGITDSIGVALMADSREYEQRSFDLTDYEADRYGFFLTFSTR